MFTKKKNNLAILILKNHTHRKNLSMKYLVGQCLQDVLTATGLEPRTT